MPSPPDNHNGGLEAARAYVAGVGIVSALGLGWEKTRKSLEKNQSNLRPLTLFTTASGQPLPVGQAPVANDGQELPRTHRLARLAAEQAMAGRCQAPDAVVMGVTTGGLFRTEILLADKVQEPGPYRWHAAASVAEDLAERFGCRGPVLTVSTACSSGAAALKIALNLLRSGMVRSVLAGGADSLCRLTYHGFRSLQLVDPAGARPLDENREGMSVGEGAAVFLLTSDEPDRYVAELLGGGLSCDAYHPTAPAPHGNGALAAMRAALCDTGMEPCAIGHVNLHGTGTRDNDTAEARALHALFGESMPMLSSVKGNCGHSLAAAGAIGAAIAAITVSQGPVPANTRCSRPDPALKLTPLLQPVRQRVDTVLSNAFGFGGNNACLVLGAPGKTKCRQGQIDARPMRVLGYSCITGAGRTRETLRALESGGSCGGVLEFARIAANLVPAQVRRLKRFPRLALSLAVEAHHQSSAKNTPSAVFLGTGWGALSETADFLGRLDETGEQFPSPTDFVGSVHNAAAGQVAMHFGATGANLTMTGGDYSFEQALAAAALMSGDGHGDFLVIGADEFHPTLSKRFDLSVFRATHPADGGGALYLSRGGTSPEPGIRPLFFESSRSNPDVLSHLTASLERGQPFNRRYGLILAGMPAACRRRAAAQLAALVRMTGYRGRIIDYRKHTGEFASASAVAVVMALHFLQQGCLPAALGEGPATDLAGTGVLVLGLGHAVTAIEVMVP